MISIYKSDASGNFYDVEDIEQGSWINIVSPSNEEILLISQKLKIPNDFIHAALDEEEGSRIEIEDDSVLVILDIPFTDIDDNSLTYDTYPLAIISAKNVIITICLKNSKILTDFINNKIPSFYTFKKTRFMIQILSRISNYYLLYLRQINKKSLIVEKTVYKSMKNREIIQLLALQKSLVYFSTSLKSNEITLEKLLKLELLQKYDEDKDILEDVIIENRQSIEMCTIYSDVLSGTMEAFASIISNNQNLVMKNLTSITIVLAIPTLISGLLGMNVKGIPFQESPMGFPTITGIVLFITISVIFYLRRKDMF
ncbi:magnesium transporter CorA family protein [Clostridium sp.]|uniref:magnesium transporter CorA family protein n=1 Tax=Clostridium sp. TaxID=1506 RepID=UPI002FC83024